MRVLYPGRTEFWSVGFCKERKTGQPEEKPSEQSENKEQSRPKYATKPESNLATLMGGKCSQH